MHWPPEVAWCASTSGKKDDYSIDNPVECIFEKGDLEQDKFRKLLLNEGRPEPIFRAKKDYAGLQAADQYAWEQPARDSFKFLLNLIPRIHGEVTQAGLIHLCQSMGIDPKTGVRR